MTMESTSADLHTKHASASPSTRHMMPGNQDEVAGLLDAYLARANETAARASLAPVMSGSDRIQSDPIGAETP